jgi:3-isopropylmalate dehydrogenase
LAIDDTYEICVMPGDGIGVDVIDATLPLLDKIAHGAQFAFRFASHPAGAQHYQATGDALPAATLAAARAADAILFGAMGWPAIRYPDGTEIAPQLDLRVELELYAGVRPARALPGIPLPLADPMDFMVLFGVFVSTLGLLGLLLVDGGLTRGPSPARRSGPP